jgi:four helix bundle protein
MATIGKFEDLNCWKLARRLCSDLYRLTSEGPFAKDFPLRDQIRRAAISIVSNIAEGFERDGNREFLQFLSIAKASSGELRSQLYIALDVGHLSEDEFKVLYQRVKEVSITIQGLIKYLRESDLTGLKNKHS